MPNISFNFSERCGAVRNSDGHSGTEVISHGFYNCKAIDSQLVAEGEHDR